MAREIPSAGNLRRKSEVADGEIAAATAADLKDEGVAPFIFKSGHRSDVAKAIEMHPRPGGCWPARRPHRRSGARLGRQP